MRLTKLDKKNFVDSVLAGMPIVNKWDSFEAKMDIQRAYDAMLPPEIQVVIKKYPDIIQRDAHKEYKELVEKGEWTKSEWNKHFIVRLVRIDGVYDDAKVDISKWVALYDAWSKEFEVRNDFRKRLSDIVNSCNTLNALKAALPELESYMPNESSAVTNLPVAAGGLVKDMLSSGLKVPKAA